MEELKACLKEIEDRLAEIRAKVTLPSIDLPDADLQEPEGDNVLVSSDMDFLEHVAACKARKRYGLDEAEAA